MLSGVFDLLICFFVFLFFEYASKNVAFGIRLVSELFFDGTVIS